MDAGSARARRTREAAKVSPTDYATFIGQIELTNIWLESSRVTNQHGPTAPEQASLAISNQARFEPAADGFNAYQGYRVRFDESDAVLAEIEVTFGLRFRSAQPMTDEIFAIFREVNLPVNTWPYLREYISTTMGRMGWMPVALPALKRGVRSPSSPGRTRTGSSQARRAVQRSEAGTAE